MQHYPRLLQLQQLQRELLQPPREPLQPQVQLLQLQLRLVSHFQASVSNSYTGMVVILATAPCLIGYTRTPSGSCVNLLFDFNNCGSIGYVCTSNYTVCSNGTCVATLVAPLTGGTAVSGWGGSFAVDDATISISVPFAVSMYGFSTSNVTLSSNGVSHFPSRFTLIVVLIILIVLGYMPWWLLSDVLKRYSSRW